MEIFSIGSGSSGNSVFVGTGNTHFIIDAGLSGKRIEEGLNRNSLSSRDLSGILVTHEHNDHVAGLGVMARRYGLPIYATPKTIEAIKNTETLGKIDESLFVEIEKDREFTLGDLSIKAISVSHDAADPVGYIFSDGRKNAAVVTDLGKYDDYIIENIRGMNVLFLEANHDKNMLEVGPYPYYLKMRILSDNGHLSNEATGTLLSSVIGDETQHIFLGHLSAENNYPELAYETVFQEITLSDTPYKGSDFPITVAKRNECSLKVAV